MALDVYQSITTRILEQLQNGTVPWHKPWYGEEGSPQNLVSRKSYRGINVFLLAAMPHDSPFWLTYRQARQLGGTVRKGAKSTSVVFWKWIERRDAETGETDRIPLLRYYNVFNLEQCELPEGKVPERPAVPQNDFEPIERCERVVEAMPSKPTIRHDASAAFYRPGTDSVHIPKRERFDGAEEFYSTLFHELIHATGHQNRLNRPGICNLSTFGSHPYSKEELVAEMGAAFLCGQTGIENRTIDNSAAYIAGWLRQLRNDRKLVIHAAAAAQKAADFILDRQFSEFASESVGGLAS